MTKDKRKKLNGQSYPNSDTLFILINNNEVINKKIKPTIFFSTLSSLIKYIIKFKYIKQIGIKINLKLKYGKKNIF